MNENSSNLTRRQFIAAAGSVAAASLGAGVTGCVPSEPSRAGEMPNVLFISVDDLNDWIGVLGGYEGTVHTPYMDRLANEGALFRHAHCTAPVCNPSRTSVLAGLRPSTTGVYLNENNLSLSKLHDAVTLPQHFRTSGYYTMSAFKVFHGRKADDPDVWDERFPAKRKSHESARKRTIDGTTGRKSKAVRWGVLHASDEELPEMDATEEFAEFLAKQHDRPFFTAFGVNAPHSPWYAPQKYFDMYPMQTLTLPTINRNDLDDVPPIGQRWAGPFSSGFPDDWTQDEWKNAVRGYLACISYADACVGRLLDVLDHSARRDDTIVVLWSDHGAHLGEKLHTSKMTLWEESTRVPFMIRAPGVTMAGTPCDRVVSLLDIYPTLIELCGLPEKPELEGSSLVPLLKDPRLPWDHPAITTYGRNNHSVRTARWRYIRYRDNTDELYDHETDPMEWTNLAKVPAHADIKKKLAKYLPRINVESASRRRQRA